MEYYYLVYIIWWRFFIFYLIMKWFKFIKTYIYHILNLKDYDSSNYSDYLMGYIVSFLI